MNISKAKMSAMVATTVLLLGGATSANSAISATSVPALIINCSRLNTPPGAPQTVVHTRRAILGRTPLEVHAKFAAIIEGNFANGAANNVMRNLSDKELAGIAHYYKTSRTDKAPHLLNILAERLDSQALVRLAGAFGTANVQAAVVRYAAKDVAENFNARVAAGEVKNISAKFAAEFQLMGAGPTIDMTLEEIYLEFRTAPVGSLGPTAAFAETTMYAATAIGKAWAVGYTIGTGISMVIQKYDPSLDDAIGGTIDAAIQNIDEKVNEMENAISNALSEGAAQRTTDSMYGNAITNSLNPYGDWDVSYDMGSGEAGGCF